MRRGLLRFNDTAVAARWLQAEAHRLRRQLLRVWVIDLDVHQGDGTATIFADDPTAFTLSLDGALNYPVRKATSDLEVAARCAATGQPAGRSDRCNR
jgi:acetoin utilization deacetylase AcuC-like enzyme